MIEFNENLYNNLLKIIIDLEYYKQMKGFEELNTDEFHNSYGNQAEEIIKDMFGSKNPNGLIFNQALLELVQSKDEKAGLLIRFNQDGTFYDSWIINFNGTFYSAEGEFGKIDNVDTNNLLITNYEKIANILKNKNGINVKKIVGIDSLENEYQNNGLNDIIDIKVGDGTFNDRDYLIDKIEDILDYFFILTIKDYNLDYYKDEAADYIREHYGFEDNNHIDYLELNEETDIITANGVFRENEPYNWEEYEAEGFPDDVDNIQFSKDELENYINEINENKRNFYSNIV